jgi:hypothetical protein
MPPDRLVRLKGPQSADTWLLHRAHPTIVGRPNSDNSPPDIDLRPDYRVSRPHARIWYAGDGWYIEDVQSMHGTWLDGYNIQSQGAVRLEPWGEVQMGDTTLMLAPHHWHRLRSRELVVDCEVSPVLNLALAHCDTPLVRRLVVRNWGVNSAVAHTLQIVLSDFADVVSIPVPALDPGQSMVLTVPPCRFNYEALEGRLEKTVKPLTIRLIGSGLQ